MPSILLCFLTYSVFYCFLWELNMKKRIILFITLILTLFSASAYTNNAIIFPSGDPVYSDMDSLYAEALLVRPSGNRPWSEAEARKLLSAVDRNSLGEYGIKLYERIEERIGRGLEMELRGGFLPFRRT